MRLMTDIVEGWVREHPEQWLGLHQRWRQPNSAGNLWFDSDSPWRIRLQVL